MAAPKTPGERLRAAIKRAGYTQESFSEAFFGENRRSWLNTKITGRSAISENEAEQFEAALKLPRGHILVGDAPRRPPRPSAIPILNKVRAGPVHDYAIAEPEIEDVEYVDAFNIHDPDAFALVVVGDSMEPTIEEDDLIIASPAADLINGCVVVVWFDEHSKHIGGCVGRYQRGDEGSIVLSKDNRRHRPVVCEPSDIRQMVRVVERRTRKSGLGNL